MPQEFAPWLGVFETLRIVRGVALFTAEHRAEAERAAVALGIGLAEPIPETRGPVERNGRMRWLITRQHGAQVGYREEQWVEPPPVALTISPVRVGSQNWDTRFKTISYLTHAQAFHLAGGGEAILLNEHGHVASAARSNIFWRRGDRLFTPVHEAGCRCGVVRGFVLKNAKVEEGHFPVAELLAADEIFLTNSMRGIVSASAIEGRALSAFSAADQLRVKYDAAIAAQLAAAGR